MVDKARTKEMETELREQRARQESIYHQKSRELWLKAGNKNTKFFHANIVVRRRRNKICSIKNGDKWLSDKKEICEYFNYNFKTLYSTTRLDMTGPDPLGPACVT